MIIPEAMFQKSSASRAKSESVKTQKIQRPTERHFNEKNCAAM